nr:MAG TPA: Neurohypophysial hormone [Caudoviricetes sp.]
MHITSAKKISQNVIIVKQNFFLKNCRRGY